LSSKKTCRYKIQKIHDGGNVCGGITIYQIVPNTGINTLRLHHIINTTTRSNGLLIDDEYQPFNNVKSIIDAVEGWNTDPPFNFNKLDRISKGLSKSDGNGIKAAFETSGRNGIWG